eukprot:CAMPEP_0183417738 /NCGR_PEP_ID=MMETSP0370-20130417/24634_1 /TAXON_ID=268820 /ORGANISM="Peridinium aciculiferum, Strain PAER-2" /LENGTH=40 /DNA_ID= /DNA_START= /DNA_END= /DNA_ORIENTATION=
MPHEVNNSAALSLIKNESPPKRPICQVHLPLEAIERKAIV